MIGEDDDIDLLRQWRNGNARAADILAERHYRDIYRYIRRHVEERSDIVADLTQQVLLTAVEKRDEVVNFRRYLFGVARFKVLAYKKSPRRDSPGNPKSSQIPEPGHGVMSIMVNREKGRRLVQALRLLPVEHQAYMMWYYADRLTHPQIAERLGLTTGQVNGHISRARAKLRVLIAELSHDRVPLSDEGVKTWMKSLRRRTERKQQPGAAKDASDAETGQSCRGRHVPDCESDEED